MLAAAWLTLFFESRLKLDKRAQQRQGLRITQIVFLLLLMHHVTLPAKRSKCQRKVFLHQGYDH